MSNPLDELDPALLTSANLCLAGMLRAVATSSNDHEAKMHIRAYVNLIGPKVLSVTWIHDKPAINHLLYRATTKTMLALAAGLINLLPQGEHRASQT